MPPTCPVNRRSAVLLKKGTLSPRNSWRSWQEVSTNRKVIRISWVLTDIFSPGAELSVSVWCSHCGGRSLTGPDQAVPTPHLTSACRSQLSREEGGGAGSMEVEGGGGGRRREGKYLHVCSLTQSHCKTVTHLPLATYTPYSIFRIYIKYLSASVFLSDIKGLISFPTSITA